MCAQIWIKGRKEPLEVTNEIAKKVKHRWCGNIETGAGKADKNDIVDLGDWAGEYGSIKSIELDRMIKPTQFKVVSFEQENPNKRYGKQRLVKRVPLNYKLEKGEEFV